MIDHTIRRPLAALTFAALIGVATPMIAQDGPPSNDPTAFVSDTPKPSTLKGKFSLVTIGALDKDYDLTDAPLIAVGAGIVAGFVYWAVAGWSAGFWKPVFASPPANPPLPLAPP